MLWQSSWLAIPLLLFTGFVSACGDDDEEAEQRSTMLSGTNETPVVNTAATGRSDQMSQLALRVAAEVHEGQLVIRYAVHNNGERDAYLLNRLHRASPPEMSPDIAYVELDARTGIVEVSKRIPDNPSTGGTGPPVPVAPYVTPVRVNETFTETIRLVLPARIYREYGRSPTPDPTRDRVVDYQGVRFTLGYYWRDPGVTETPGVALGQPVIIPGGFPRFPELLQIVSPVVMVRVQVVEPGQ